MIQNFHYDAQAALGFVLSQTSHIETKVNETIYPEIQYSYLVPVDNSAHPFAKTVTYYSMDMYGRAEWINGNADDVPLAGTSRTKEEKPLYTAGIGYGYGWEELGQAMMLGMSLPADDAKAARRASEEFIDNVALRGSTEKGFMGGLINHTSVTPVAATTGNWLTATPAQIIVDFNLGISASWVGTKYTSIADTVLLPNTRFDLLNTIVLPNTTMTLLAFLRANNTFTNQTGRPLLIRGVRGLETAGVGNTNRMVAYRRDEDVLKMHIPMPHRFLPAYQAGPLRVQVPGVMRVGALDIRRPAEVRYVDGI